ncbi:hypothetical protein L7F22_052377 [Adiantum nelumboides]|nr:hypothetical protein [Adiantum nelumboides]
MSYKMRAELAETWIPLLLQADDIVLIFDSSEGLQCHLDALHAFAHFRTPIPGTVHCESQRLTPDVPPGTQVTPDSQASGRQSRRYIYYGDYGSNI